MMLPNGIIEEQPGRNLDSLVKNAALLQLQNTLIHQWNIRHAFEDVEAYGIKPTTMALFHGPPGNGKTMAAKMLANVIDAPLYRVACEGLIESYLGKSEANMSLILEWLQQQGRCVVLFDECEAIFRSRGDGGSCQQAIARTMQVFWQAVDNWETPQMFLLATNRFEDLDAAILSRCELHLEFVGPTKEQALSVIDYWSETLHDHGADKWAEKLRQGVKDRPPISFRDLWQQISHEVRAFIIAANQ